ncbi:MAG: hypothetical protein JNK81_01920 [Anaerolineales bacterium]|nr:hypothetical protein [Anaerolineales bacterium]
MKTDITIPNSVYQAAEKLAKKEGISLSELYTAALNAYVAEHSDKNIAESSDVAYLTQLADNELVDLQIIAEFNAWEVASDEALQNFEKGLEKT